MRARSQIEIHDLRTWTYDRHRTADDRPYGGGAGMVLMAPPIVEGVESVLAGRMARVLITSAGGRNFDQRFRGRASGRRTTLCSSAGTTKESTPGSTEILDAEEVSIGDYVLTGGELPAMVIVDAVTRLIPGVIDDASIVEESHQEGLVEYPHYTRPAEFRGLAVPPVLLSGHHAEVAKWRRAQSLERTAERESDFEIGRRFPNLPQHAQAREIPLRDRTHIDRQRCLDFARQRRIDA